jgi:hypothetical protein
LSFRLILQAFYSELKNEGCDMQGRISDYLLDRINRIIWIYFLRHFHPAVVILEVDYGAAGPESEKSCLARRSETSEGGLILSKL